MATAVLKFGGTSVGTPERIFKVAERIKSYHENKTRTVVVVSAMGSTTDDLISLARQITSTPSDREMDMLLSTGEQVTISLLAMALTEIGVPAVSLTGQMGGIKTNSMHAKARIESLDAGRIIGELNQNKVVIVAGFQGIDDFGDITTLGRGGSDTTAVAVAAAINADVCEIFTDVDGVYTTDPRLCKTAQKLTSISYDEMLEMAKLGAGVLHPRSVELASKYKLPIAVRTSFNYDEGTIVREAEKVERAQIRGVALDDEITRISVTGIPDTPGMCFALFKNLADQNIAVDMIIQNLVRNHKNDISFTVPDDEMQKAKKVSEEFVNSVGGESIDITSEVAKVSIIGTAIAGNADTASKLFETLSNSGVNIDMISTSETRISCIIPLDCGKDMVSKIHDAFELGKNK